jgi:hypothetical protein
MRRSLSFFSLLIFGFGCSSEAHHFVFDHCDFSGGEDETFDVTFGHDFTVQWSTITNSGPSGQARPVLVGPTRA